MPRPLSMLKKLAIPGCLVAGLLFWLAAAHAAEPRRISVHAPQAVYQVDILLHEGVDYVGLTDLLEPLGRLDLRVDGKKLHLSFNGAEAEFHDGKRGGKVRSDKFELPVNFLLIDGRGYVPAAAVEKLLPRLADLPVEFHPAARRLFIGNSQVRYSSELQHSPSRLVLTFSAPVNPQVQLEKNRLRLVFRREAVVAASPASLQFNDPLITSAAFEEAPGVVDMVITAAQPIAATLGNGGRTITIAAAPVAAPPAAPRPAQLQAAAADAAQHPGRNKPFVVIDAAHGGTDPGQMFSASVAEKNITLALARRLQHELEMRGVAVVVIRPADSLLTWDQRAVAANTSHASLYVALHASSYGSGVRLYTALLPPLQAGQDRRSFLPWESAQAPFLSQSRVAVNEVAAQVQSAGLRVQSSAVPMRPLNSVTLAAFAVEVSPTAGSVDELSANDYQQKVASALASAILNLRGRIEEAP